MNMGGYTEHIRTNANVIYIQYIYNLNENENVCGMVAIFCRNDCDNMGEKITIKFAYTRAH